MHETNGSKYSSEDSIEGSLNGDTSSFKMLVDQYSDYAYRIAFKTLLDKDDAKDVVQESFIRVWKHLGKYRREIKFTTWLYKIVVNICYDKLKSNKRRKAVMDNINTDNLENINAVSENPEKRMSDNDFAGIISKLAEKLSIKQRMVFVLRDLQNLSIEEVSGILGMSSGSVKTNLFLARKNIAKKLSAIDNTEI